MLLESGWCWHSLRMPNDLMVILTSVANDADAHRLAEGLVREKLAACVQISAAGASVYCWQGKIENEAEYYLNIKTSVAKAAAAEAWLLQHHPYETPEVVQLEASASAAYVDWLGKQTDG